RRARRRVRLRDREPVMAMRSEMSEAAIGAFWNAHPCGNDQVRALDRTQQGDYERFFARYDEFKYGLERHIPSTLDALDLSGKQLLEVGPGEGAEAEQLIRRGAEWSGVDLTEEAVDRVRTRLTLRGLPFGEIRQASVLALPFADAEFDVVFSHGV